ncbi:hypothetical protein CQA26_23090, partial [Providencia rettgeri]
TSQPEIVSTFTLLSWLCVVNFFVGQCSQCSRTYVRCACCALSALNFTLLAHAARVCDRKFQV